MATDASSAFFSLTQAEYAAGNFDRDEYIDVLEQGLSMLNAFDNQLDAKINNGSIVDPEAVQLLDDSALLRASVEALIDSL